MKCNKCNKDHCIFVTKSDVKERRAQIKKIINSTNNKIKNFDLNGTKIYSGFSCAMVGSAKRNIVYKRKESPYDIDFQLYFTSTKNYPLSLKKDLAKIINDVSSSEWIATISTSVIELKNTNNGWSFDFAIIDRKSAGDKILKGKVDSEYKWDDLPKYRNTLKKFKGNDTTKIKQEYLNLKCINWVLTNNVKNHKDYKPSVSILIEAINNVT